ncbi:MFS transporter [Blastococcus sp. Marseille-P5729]|uniref:MFS transporter n=1 Tax=Blastococcus sp. Marseille-P5729 TaxID=2086582 RepID=UPI000D0E76E8|nr:MFS transporter [Blastococcus sp. Marseille-P5729]
MTSVTEEPRLRSAIVKLAFSLFAVAMSSQAVSPLLLYYTHDLKLSGTILTAFFAIYALGLVPALLLGGAHSDRIGRKAVVYPSVVLVLCAVLALESAAAFGEAALIVARLLQGLTAGACFTVGAVWLRELAGPTHAKRAAMIASGVMAFGFASGPLTTGILVQWAPWPKILPMLVPAVLLAIALILLRSVPETVTERRYGKIRVGVPRESVAGFFAYLLPIALLTYTPAMLALTIFPLQIAETGVGMIYALAGLSMFFVQGTAAYAAIYARRWGPKACGWLSGFLCAIGCLCGYFAVQPDGWPWLIPASLLIGFSGGLAMTGGLMVADLVAPPDRRGALVSMFYVVVYFGFMVPTIFSLIWGKQTLEEGSTVMIHAIVAFILGLVLLGPGRRVVQRAESAAVAEG